VNIPTLKHITCDNGERAVLLADQSGIPLYYPNLFITTQVRAASMALGTIKMSLIALQVLERWQSEYRVDLVKRFQSSKFLTGYELDSLRDFCKKRISPVQVGDDQSQILPFGKVQDFVSRNTQYQRMSVTAQYLDFLAVTLHNKQLDQELKGSVDSMVNTFKKRRPRQQSRYKVEQLDSALSETTLERLHQITREFDPENPFAPNVRFRNVLIIELFASLGLRKGELANIRLDDINFQSNTLRVKRRPDEMTDTRKHQPVVKTAERTLPISSHLSLCIQEYQIRQRRKMVAAKKHGYLFVSHKGSTEGLPLSISSIDYIFKQLKVAVDDRTLSPHKLRHQWNYEFSLSLDLSKQKLSEAQEEQMRSYLMGWNPTSGMASTYNRRHIVEKAHQSIEKHQERLAKMKRRSDG